MFVHLCSISVRILLAVSHAHRSRHAATGAEHKKEDTGKLKGVKMLMAIFFCFSVHNS